MEVGKCNSPQFGGGAASPSPDPFNRISVILFNTGNTYYEKRGVSRENEAAT